MRSIVKNKTEYIYLNSQELDSLKSVHGCSGVKHIIDNRFFMEDDLVDAKDYSLCLKKELNGAQLFFDPITIQSISEIMEISIDFEQNRKEKKHILKSLFPNMNEEEIDNIYQLVLNACRRYTSANLFKIAKVDTDVSKTNRYILFSEISNIMGLSDCVPIVSACCLINNDQIKRGCIIEKIEGIDIVFWNSFDEKKKDAFIDFNLTEEGFRDLTSIHLIDYLTGYIDRNVTNIIFRMNQYGEISKCVAIDNDVCFGCSTIDDLKITRLGDLSRITYIDYSLYKRFKEIDPIILEKALNDYLSQKEIEFFLKRYNELLNHIQQRMQVVNLGEWSKYRKELDSHPYIKKYRAVIDDINKNGMTL